ncbi:RNase H-like domain-containing protein, partial [Escherichia coli]|uniref:RNase H-like domain-containing protein n=1 Tax=Escherichia coli TaxID=562 RepID=UPI001411EA22|nr:hypothetical protein [Escherichia coli]
KAPLLSKPCKGDTLSLYLGISPSALSAVLVRMEDRTELPVYYISKRLLEAESRYSQMERLAFCVVVASRKLRPYFQAHSIRVLTKYP